MKRKQWVRTRDAKPEVKVFVMMCEVIFFHLAHVLWEFGVMQPMRCLSIKKRMQSEYIRIVHAVVEDICAQTGVSVRLER